MSGNIENQRGGTATTSQQTHYVDHESGSLSTTVIMTVAEIADIDPAKIGTPLYDSVDPDALDNLFSDRHDGSARADGHVVFTLYGYDVTVHSDGRIVVRE